MVRETQNVEAEAQQEAVLVSPRLIDNETGKEISAPEDTAFEPSELFAGNVLTIRDDDAKGAKRHYLIHSVEGEPPAEVRISPARSNLKKSVLMLALLGVAWFVVRWAIHLVVN